MKITLPQTADSQFSVLNDSFQQPHLADLKLAQDAHIPAPQLFNSVCDKAANTVRNAWAKHMRDNGINDPAITADAANALGDQVKAALVGNEALQQSMTTLIENSYLPELDKLHKTRNAMVDAENKFAPLDNTQEREITNRYPTEPEAPTAEQSVDYKLAKRKANAEIQHASALANADQKFNSELQRIEALKEPMLQEARSVQAIAAINQQVQTLLGDALANLNVDMSQVPALAPRTPSPTVASAEPAGVAAPVTVHAAGRN